MYITNGRNTFQREFNNLGAEAVTRGVGGMSTHWWNHFPTLGIHRSWRQLFLQDLCHPRISERDRAPKGISRRCQGWRRMETLVPCCAHLNRDLGTWVRPLDSPQCRSPDSPEGVPWPRSQGSPASLPPYCGWISVCPMALCRERKGSTSSRSPDAKPNNGYTGLRRYVHQAR